jgi:hypothetical protein
MKIERGEHGKPEPITDEAYSELCAFWDEIDNGRST